MLDSPDIKLTRKERERTARRDEILAAARAVFSNRGFERARLDEIAEVAEIGKGTIYNYFKNKEELFVSVIVHGIRSFQKFVQQAVGKAASPRERVALYIDAACEFFERHRQLFSIFEFERATLTRSLDEKMMQTFCEKESGIIQFIEQMFFEGVKRGEFRQMSPAKLAKTLHGMIHIAAIHAVRQPEAHDLKEEAELIKQILFNGILRQS